MQAGIGRRTTAARRGSGGPPRDAGVRGQRRGPPAPDRGAPREGGIRAAGRRQGGGRERGGPADRDHAALRRPAGGRAAGPQGREERRQPAAGRSRGAPVRQGDPRRRGEGGAAVGALRALRRGGHRGGGGRRPAVRLGRDPLEARRDRGAARPRGRHPRRAQRPARPGLLPGGRAPAPARSTRRSTAILSSSAGPVVPTRRSGSSWRGAGSPSPARSAARSSRWRSACSPAAPSPSPSATR